QRYLEPRSFAILFWAFWAFPVDFPAKLCYPARHNRQTQSRSLRFRRKERLQNLFSKSRRNSRSVIFHEQGQISVLPYGGHAYASSARRGLRSEEHTSELQSQSNL